MAEEGKVIVRLIKPTLVAGQWHEAGDFVEVYPMEKDWMIVNGYVAEE